MGLKVTKVKIGSIIVTPSTKYHLHLVFTLGTHHPLDETQKHFDFQAAIKDL